MLILFISPPPTPLTCSRATGVFFCTPSACLVLGQLLCVCQLVASGTLKERGDRWTKKREGSSSGLCKHVGVSFFSPLFVVHPYCPSAQLGKKVFFPPLSCSFCSAGGERNVGVKWALFVMPWPFISLWNGPFISWPTFAAGLSDFSPRTLTHMGSWIAFTPVIVG